MTHLGKAAKLAHDGAIATGLTEEEAWDSASLAVLAGSQRSGPGIRPDGDPPSGGDVGN